MSRPCLTLVLKNDTSSDDWNFKFCDACKTDDVKAAQLAIFNGAKNWYPGFRYACQNGSIKIVNLIIISSKGRLDWENGMYNAAFGGHLNILQLLVVKISKMPNVVRFINWNHIFYGACRGGHIEIVQFAISKGADDWTYGFQAACHSGHMPMIEFIISKLNEVYTTNWTNIWRMGLNHACLGGHMNIAKFMISKASGGCDWNLAFLEACSGGSMELVQFMISKGADCWIYGLHNAWANSHIEIVGLMISKGVDCLDRFYSWPKRDFEIYKLLYLGIKLDKFSKILGYQELQTLVAHTRQSILKNRMMLPDLLGIVSEYIII